MKSVDFTVQRLLGTSLDSSARLQCHSQFPTEDKNDQVTADDVNNDDDERRSTGARNDEHDDALSRQRHVEPLLIHPSIYLDYARQFLWQLTAAYRPGYTLLTYLCVKLSLI